MDEGMATDETTAFTVDLAPGETIEYELMVEK